MASAVLLAGAAAVAEAATVCAAAAAYRRRHAAVAQPPAAPAEQPAVPAEPPAELAEQPPAPPAPPAPSAPPAPEGPGGRDEFPPPFDFNATATAGCADLPVVLSEKVRLFMNIAMIDFAVTLNLVSNGNIAAMPLQHGAQTTHEVPLCIFMGWCPRTRRKCLDEPLQRKRNPIHISGQA